MILGFCRPASAADFAMADAPQLDVLHIPGGFGQEALMDKPLLALTRRRSTASE